MAHTQKNGHKKTKLFRMPIFAKWLIAIFQHIDTDIVILGSVGRAYPSKNN